MDCSFFAFYTDNKHIVRQTFRYIFFFGLTVLFGCSSQSNTLTSKAYHNTTAHFNGYFYANEEIKKIEKTIWSALIDDYNRILRLYPGLDSALAKNYDKEIQETVKMASLAIQRHPNSKWVDDSYILVGKARLYSLDWGNAVQTFKYVNTKSKDPEARQRAIINLVRTFTEHREFNNAQAAIDFVQKEKLSKDNKKSLLLEKAYFYQMQGDYDNMVRNLSEAAPLLKKRDKPGRIYFIIGQVYQKLGFESEAYNYYKKCLSTNPEYEVDFYARLYMAQVTEISRSRSVNAARKSFRKLLKDNKNKNFKDKIFYEMGVFDLKQKDIPEAIASFNHSIREGSNKKIDGEAYLQLGEIYFDTLKNYGLSQAYYDSAVATLPRDYEGYEAIKTRKEVLDEFVKNLNTIQWQDSLLSMTTLDSVSLRARIDSIFDAQKKEAEKLAGKKKKKSNRIEIAPNSNNIFDQGNQQADERVGWYFGNPSAMSVGQTEFKRIWGDVPLEDNWRRSMRSAITGGQLRDQAVQFNSDPVAPDEVPVVTVDPAIAEFDKLNKQIPRTEEQKSASLKKIEEAYFNLGDIYYFKLMDNNKAITYYTKLLTRFPESEYEPDVLYKLYLIYKDTDPEKSESYATILKQKHPTSTFAKTLVNPGYLAESSLAAEKQKVLYKKAYDLFHEGKYTAAKEAVQEGFDLGETSFTVNLKLLKIMITGKVEDITRYQFELDEFIKEYPEDPLTAYAKKLKQASLDLKLTLEQNSVNYIRSLEEPHYFVLVHKNSEKLTGPATTLLEKFNAQYFKELELKTSNLVLNEDYTITIVAELPRISFALEYNQTFNEKLPSLTELRNHKFNTFVITKDNFNIFYRTKGLDEYLKFFEKNYPAEN